jgi:hypothetical protein
LQKPVIAVVVKKIIVTSEIISGISVAIVWPVERKVKATVITLVIIDVCNFSLCQIATYFLISQEWQFAQFIWMLPCPITAAGTATE